MGIAGNWPEIRGHGRAGRVQEAPRDAAAPSQRHWLDPVCAWLSLGVPLIVTALRASPATQWRDDLSIVRGLGIVPIGGEGTLSSLLMQLSSLLPIGGRLLRASLVSAVGLALSARLAYALARRLLDDNAHTPRLTPPLALAAVLIATLSPVWQLEGTIAGGATLSVALVLGGLLVRPRAETRDARVWLGFGALIALTVFESHVAGLALMLVLGVQVAVLAEVPPRRNVVLCAAGAGIATLLCLVPALVRPLSGRAWVDLGYGLSTAPLAAVDTAARKAGALTAWLRDVGVISMGLAVMGGAWGLLRARTRWLMAPLGALVLADVVFPASRAGVLSPDPLSPLRLSAVIALGIAAALGVHTVALGLRRANIPMARPAAVLLVVFNFTLVLVTAEDSSYVADRRSQYGAEVWTDEALGDLPPHSMLLIRSPAVAWRLWAARLVRGERPDIVVVPLPLLDRGSIASELLAREPKLAPLVRDMAIRGRPTEYSLSTLADARPLYVELDPNWDQRLVDHLTPRPLWLGFAPHALGRSDRTPALAEEHKAFSRVLAAAITPQHRDGATLAVLASRAQEQAVALAALGDRDSVRAILADLERIDPDQPFVAKMEKRFEADHRGRVDVAGLLP